jgi:uncharacterized membrane protein YbjE (DUF340 family)
VTFTAEAEATFLEGCLLLLGELAREFITLLLTPFGVRVSSAFSSLSVEI